MSLNQLSKGWACASAADLHAASANIIKALTTDDEKEARDALQRARACLNTAHEAIISATITAKP